MAIGSHFDISNHVEQPQLVQPGWGFSDPLSIVLYQISGFIFVTADAHTYLQLYDQLEAPDGVGDTVPVRRYHLTPGANFSINLEGPPADKGRRFELGCWLALSTQPLIYAAPVVPANNILAVAAVGRTLENPPP